MFEEIAVQAERLGSSRSRVLAAALELAHDVLDALTADDLADA